MDDRPSSSSSIRPELVEPVEPAEPYSIDNFFLILHGVQKSLDYIYYDFRRVKGRIDFGKVQLVKIAIYIISFDVVCNFVKIIQLVQESKLSEAQQVGAVYSIELLCFLRSLSVWAKHRSIAEMANKIDRIYPRTKRMQRLMGLRRVIDEITFRFRCLHVYTTVGLIVFCGMPLMKYFLYYEKGDPVADEYHQHASWLPFGIKQNYRCYPFIYCVEIAMTIIGFTFILTWDHAFTILLTLLRMHFTFLNRQVERLDASETLDPAKAPEFYRRVREIIAYQQHLNYLGREFNHIFDFSILTSDMMCAASICFHLYLIANTSDVMSIILFLFPALVLVFFIYDISNQGTKFTTETFGLREALYHHNWYEGSLDYRKFICMWMQNANEPITLSGFGLMTVNMTHFRKMMTVAYQMFTFLQSRKNKSSGL